MSASTSTINLKIDPDVKREAKRVFDDLGMDMTTAITLFLKQSVRENGMPFRPTNTVRGLSIPPQLIAEPRRIGGMPVLPADWDDAEDAIYDGLYAD